MESTREQIRAGRELGLVREAFARLEAREPDAAGNLCDDEFELRWTALGRNGHSHEGRDAFERHLDDVSHGWQEVQVILDRVTDGANRVLAFYRLLGHARDGTRAESPHAAVVRLRDGRLWRWDAFQDAAHSFDWLAAEARLA
jgi:ketosteroid isomerase-like protein